MPEKPEGKPNFSNPLDVFKDQPANAEEIMRVMTQIAGFFQNKENRGVVEILKKSISDDLNIEYVSDTAKKLSKVIDKSNPDGDNKLSDLQIAHAMHRAMDKLKGFGVFHEVEQEDMGNDVIKLVFRPTAFQTDKPN